MQNKKLLFVKDSSYNFKLAILVLFSLVFFIFFNNKTTDKIVKKNLRYFIIPSAYSAQLIQYYISRIDYFFTSKANIAKLNNNLLLEIRNLSFNNRELQEKLANIKEIKKLEALINIPNKTLKIARVIGSTIESQTSQIIYINKGSDDGISEQAVVLDEKGILGQIIEILPHKSIVMLITDYRHSLPVKAVKNNLKFLADGSGLNKLIISTNLQNINLSKGDLIVSSGLGERFPVNYPVGVVKNVYYSKIESKTIIEVTPFFSYNTNFVSIYDK